MQFEKPSCVKSRHLKLKALNADLSNLKCIQLKIGDRLKIGFWYFDIYWIIYQYAFINRLRMLSLKILTHSNDSQSSYETICRIKTSICIPVYSSVICGIMMFIINSDLFIGCLIRGLPNVLTTNFYENSYSVIALLIIIILRKVLIYLVIFLVNW